MTKLLTPSKGFLAPALAAFALAILGGQQSQAQTLTITLGSQETLWLDANNCNASGPRAAWLSFIITNTGGAAASNVSATFAGFTGTPSGLVQPSYFSLAAGDLTRNITTIPAGASEPVYYYVDYSAVCAHSLGGGNPYTGYTANYSLTVTASNAATVVRNSSVTTGDLLSANAAGQALGNTISAGYWVGQILTHTVSYGFGNNTDLFFQPAGESGFDAGCIRLVGSEITSVTGTVPVSLVGLKDRLWFPTADTSGSGGNINLTYTWQIQCVNRAQNLSPWAAAKSGQKYKYTGFGSTTIFPASTNAVTASKTVNPSSLASATGTVEYTVNFTNSATVPIRLARATDVLPACMSINNPASSGSGITASNSSSIPLANATGTVNWNGIDLGDSPTSTYQVPASGTLVLKYTTNVTGCAPGSHVNSVTGLVGTTTIGPATSTLNIGSADLQVTKTDSSTTYSPGSNVVYTVVVTNNGPSAVTGATVTDNLPAGITTASWTASSTGGATGFAASGNGAISNTVNMPNGSTITYIVTMAVPSGFTGNLVNTATVAVPSGMTDPTPSNNSATDTDTQVSNADLSATKTDGSTTYTPGTTVVYTVVVANAGPNAVTGATVSDAIPSTVTSMSWTASATGGATGFTASGSGTIADLVNMPNGSTITYLVSVVVPSTRTGNLVNSVTVTAPSGVNDPTPGNNSVTDTDTQASSADLVVTKTDGSATYTPGNNVAYTIVVSNLGPSVATGATFVDALPSGITTSNWTAVAAGGATGAPVSGSGAISHTLNLPVGGSVTYTVTMAVPADRTGDLVNTATATVPVGTTDPTPGNNSVTDTDTQASIADLVVTKTDGSATYTPGGNVVYTVTVTNSGPSVATGVAITDPLPSGITTSNWTASATGGATGFAVSGSGAISNTVNMPVGSVITYVVTMAVPADRTGDLVNQANATVPLGTTDPTPGNNTATDTDTQASSTDLVVTKTDGSATYTPGTTVTYTVTVTNNGPSVATGATLADPLPSGIVTSNWTASATGGATGFAVSGTGAISNTVNMPVGSTITYVVNMPVPAGRTGDLVNVATATVPPGATDPTPLNNSATDTDTLASVADLSVTKTDGSATYTPGTSVIYTVVVSNAGPSGVTSATVSDPLPSGIVSSSWTASATGGATGFAASGSGAILNTVNMPSGSTITYIVTMLVPAGRTGDLVNQVTVSTPGGTTDPTPENNTATDTDTQASSADLSVTKSDGSLTYTPGSSVVYQIVVSNAGPSSVTGATVVDTLPTDITSASWTASATGGATGFAASGTGAISNVVNMPSGSTITYVVTVNVPVSRIGNLVNSVTVTPPGGVNDPTPGNNTATDTDVMLGSADLALTKNDNVYLYKAGTDLTYTVTVTNQGPTANTGFTVTDALPSGTSFVSAAPGCSFSSGTVTCSSAGLALGASASWTITIRPDTGRTGCLTNTALIASNTTPDPNATNNSATDTDYELLPLAQSSGLGFSSGYPSFSGNNTATAATSYNSTTQLFQLNSTPAAMRFSAVDVNHAIASGTLAVRAMVNNSGVLTGGVNGSDVTLTGTLTDDNNIPYTGTLLTGEIVQFGYRELGATDRFELRFVVTGGALAGKFLGKDLGIVITAESSTFNNSFSVNFNSRGKFTAGSLLQLCAIN